MASVQCLRLFEHFFIVVDVLLAVIAAVAVLYEGRARLPKHLEIIASNFHYCTIRACGNLVSMTVPPYIAIAARSTNSGELLSRSMMLLHDNAPVHEAKKVQATVLQCDLNIPLKKHLRGHRSSSDTDIKTDVRSQLPPGWNIISPSKV